MRFPVRLLEHNSVSMATAVWNWVVGQQWGLNPPFASTKHHYILTSKLARSADFWATAWELTTEVLSQKILTGKGDAGAVQE